MQCCSEQGVGPLLCEVCIQSVQYTIPVQTIWEDVIHIILHTNTYMNSTHGILAGRPTGRTRMSGAGDERTLQFR